MEPENSLVVSTGNMIEKALASGADLEKLEKLLLLKERYDMNEAKKAYNRAMADFKANPPRIEKDKRANFEGRTGGKVNYGFSSLPNILDKVTAELSKHGLSASWRVKQNTQIEVTCIISHVDGYSEQTSILADAETSGAKNPIQAIGSAIKYLEKYTLFAILGLADHDQEDDGKMTAEEKLDENKTAIIKDLIIETGVDREKFLAYMEIEKIEDIPISQFIKAKTALESKKRKGAVK